MVDTVFDATTLILTAKIDLLELLADEMKITATPEVQDESTSAETYDARMIEEKVENGKVTIKQPDEDDLEKLLGKFNLDRGEASSIALYREIGADLLATDDGKAMDACKILGVKFTTSLKLLQRVHEKGLVSEERALAKLEELEEYGWYETRQIDKTRQKILGEEK